MNRYCYSVTRDNKASMMSDERGTFDDAQEAAVAAGEEFGLTAEEVAELAKVKFHYFMAADGETTTGECIDIYVFEPCVGD